VGSTVVFNSGETSFNYSLSSLTVMTGILPLGIPVIDCRWGASNALVWLPWCSVVGLTVEKGRTSCAVAVMGLDWVQNQHQFFETGISFDF
jgi:hypothetical protein